MFSPRWSECDRSLSASDTKPRSRFSPALVVGHLLGAHEWCYICKNLATVPIGAILAAQDRFAVKVGMHGAVAPGGLCVTCDGFETEGEDVGRWNTNDRRMPVFCTPCLARMLAEESLAGGSCCPSRKNAARSLAGSWLHKRFLATQKSGVAAVIGIGADTWGRVGIKRD